MEIHVWGSAGKMEETLKDRGMKVRREGRVMRIGHTGDDTYESILKAAADVGTQVRRMHDHEGHPRRFVSSNNGASRAGCQEH